MTGLVCTVSELTLQWFGDPPCTQTFDVFRDWMLGKSIPMTWYAGPVPLDRCDTAGWDPCVQCLVNPGGCSWAGYDGPYGSYSCATCGGIGNNLGPLYQDVGGNCVESPGSSHGVRIIVANMPIQVSRMSDGTGAVCDWQFQTRLSFFVQTWSSGSGLLYTGPIQQPAARTVVVDNLRTCGDVGRAARDSALGVWASEPGPFNGVYMTWLVS